MTNSHTARTDLVTPAILERLYCVLQSFSIEENCIFKTNAYIIQHSQCLKVYPAYNGATSRVALNEYQIGEDLSFFSPKSQALITELNDFFSVQRQKAEAWSYSDMAEKIFSTLIHKVGESRHLDFHEFVQKYTPQKSKKNKTDIFALELTLYIERNQLSKTTPEAPTTSPQPHKKNKI